MFNLGGALTHRDLGDLPQRNNRIHASHRDWQALDIRSAQPIFRREPHRDVARLSGRIDPIADLHTSECNS